ncbi:MAG TPA: tyrosine-type recombinase/integrase [Pseudonocardiaceae bacterium]|jgi:integrase|nr:tyrosine-type recombinase/integrase [Pseudonocardiaceae bacterium]
MTSMRERAEEYLTMRRELGYRLACQGRLLLDFADHMDRAGQTRLTTQAALSWATQSPTTMAVTRRLRLSVVRCFARHLATLDPTCEVPPTGLLRAPTRRPTPYLYSPEEVSALVHAAGTLPAPLPAATYQALISLLAATGMRIGEALGLKRSDVDLEAGVLQVTGKYGKVRLVPLHPSVTGMLGDYAARRDQLCPYPQSTSFFITSTGRRVPASLVQRTFWQLLDWAGIHAPARECPGRASTTSGIPSPSLLTCAGTRKEPTFTPTRPCCPPTWDIDAHPTPTGI